LPPERNAFNLLQYGHSNPVNYKDPLGLDAITDDEGIQDCIWCIYTKAGFGHSNAEESLWVTCAEGEGFGCIVWPSTKEAGTSRISQTTWQGATPQDACALIHTHPRKKTPKPSDCENCDVYQAHRLGMPIYSVHPSGIWKYDPQDKEVGKGKFSMEAGGKWFKGAKKRCKKPCQGIPVPGGKR
jgi:hypothetical protein